MYQLVQGIPAGKVLTYGLISAMLGGRLSAQAVGWALRALTAKAKQGPYTLKNVPWHRVVSATGQLSTCKNPNILPGLQESLLKKEGIKFNGEGKINLRHYLWLGSLAYQQKVDERS